jgi:hypothetical protein
VGADSPAKAVSAGAIVFIARHCDMLFPEVVHGNCGDQFLGQAPRIL